MWKRKKGSRKGSLYLFYKEVGVAERITSRRPGDLNTINVNRPDEIRWWCSNLGCNEMRLKNAVRAVGTSAEAVKKYMTEKLTL